MGKLSDDAKALLGSYKMNLRKLTQESTDEFFQAIKDNQKLIKATSVSKIEIGKFYFIRYDYNGNKLWWPIYAMGDRQDKAVFEVVYNKPILYACNLNYIPFIPKVLIFDKIYSNFKDIFEKNRDKQNVKEEKPLSELNFQLMYKVLKDNGRFDYTVTAFDATKILDIYSVSTESLLRFLFVDCRVVNRNEMSNLYVKLEDSNERAKIKELIEFYDKILETYEQDLILGYKALKSYEENMKLFKNII